MCDQITLPSRSGLSRDCRHLRRTGERARRNVSPLMAEIPEIVSEPPIIDRLVLHIWPTRPPRSPHSTPVIPMRAMTEIRDDVFFVAVILATQIGTQYRQNRRGERGQLAPARGREGGCKRTLMISRPPAGFVISMTCDSTLLR